MTAATQVARTTAKGLGWPDPVDLGDPGTGHADGTGDTRDSGGRGLGWPDPGPAAPGDDPQSAGEQPDPSTPRKSRRRPASAAVDPADLAVRPDAIAGPEALSPDPALPPLADVSRETDRPPLADVSRETGFASANSGVPTAEEFSVLDVVSRETEDTPIARAAETAVRVLAGRLGDAASAARRGPGC